MQNGYLLLCEPNWMDFHLRHSIAGRIVYCRGPETHVRSIYPGEPVFCIRRGDKQHQVHMWGYFAWHEKLLIASAWPKFQTSLGAASEAGWMELLMRLPAIRGKQEFGAIVLADIAVPAEPLALSQVGVETRNTTNGRSLTPLEVQSIFAAMKSNLFPTLEYSPHANQSREIASRQILARLGQAAFRRAAISRYGPQCMISGCAVDEIIEAAHICPPTGERDNHPDNALLLRSDLHTLFDLDLLGIEPNSLNVHLHPKIDDPEYTTFNRAVLSAPINSGPSALALAVRWKQFRHRLKSE